MGKPEWCLRSSRLIALLCSAQALCLAVLTLVVQDVRALRPDPLAQLGEMLRQPRIPDGPCDALGQGILCRPQVGGRLLPLPQLLIGSGAVPEGYRPLQTVGLDGACRQERDPAVKSV